MIIFLGSIESNDSPFFVPDTGYLYLLPLQQPELTGRVLSSSWTFAQNLRRFW